jgi:hypothetical protein
MIKLIQKLRNNGPIKEEAAAEEYFHIIFPSSHNHLCDFIANHVKEKFKVSCTSIKYSKLDKNSIRVIGDEIKKSRILVIGFNESLNLENSYKLGIAQPCNNHIVLVNLCPSASQNPSSNCLTNIPDFIRYHFLILLEEGEGTSEKFISKLEKIVEVILSKCLVSTLYLKALSVCESLENQMNCSIIKLDEPSFHSALIGNGTIYIQSLFLRYMDDEENLYGELLFILIKDKSKMLDVLRLRQSSSNFPEDFKILESYFSAKNVTINANRIDSLDIMSNDKIWNGDRIQGDKVMGDKDTVAGNKMRAKNTAGDAIAGNKIVNTSQNLAEAAKDIKALITQLSTDHDTTTPAGKRSLSNKILETLEGNTTIQARAINAIKEMGKTALEEAIDHPVAKVLVAGLEGYIE